MAHSSYMLMVVFVTMHTAIVHMQVLGYLFMLVVMTMHSTVMLVKVFSNFLMLMFEV
jgi:hypothetical protein